MTIRSYVKDNQNFYEVDVRVFDKGGRRHFRRRRGFASPKAAKIAERELIEELSELRVGERPSTWSEWHTKIIERLKLKLRTSTVMSYDGQVKAWTYHWNKVALKDIRPNDVYETVFERAAELSPGSKRCLLKMIRKIFEYAVVEGLIVRNPALGITVQVPQTTQAVLTALEAQKFLGEAKQLSHEFYEVWAAALLTGIRSGELYALKPEDIDRGGRIVNVRRSWSSKDGFGPTKSRQHRVVDICDDLEMLLKELDAKYGREREFLLPHPWRWTKGLQARITREFCESIGVTSVKFHDLRATFITNLLSRGVSLAQVMSMVGHRELSTTNKYLRLAGVDIKGATQNLGYSLPRYELAKIINLSEKRE